MNHSEQSRHAAAIHVASVAALNTLVQRDSSPLIIASIVAGPRSLGYARFKKPVNPVLTTSELRSRILVVLAGELAVSELTGTADGVSLIQADRQATFQHALRLCVNFVALTEPHLTGSDFTQRVQLVLLEMVEEARLILHQNAPKLRRVADALLERQTITQRDLNALLI